VIRYHPISVRWHSDAGHAWLEVPSAVLDSLGVRPSVFSYTDGAGTVFLEEDSDAGAFLGAVKAAGVPLVFRPAWLGDWSGVRDLWPCEGGS